MGRLRAIFAVLGAGPGLDREQARELHLTVGVMAPMHRASPIDQVEERRGKQGKNLMGDPIVAGLRRQVRLVQALRLAALAVDRIRGFAGFCHWRCVAIAGGWALR